jgi:hypothetical protein
MIKDDFHYYIANQEEIIKDHLEEFVVIKDAVVIGYFKDEEKAFKSMIGNELGTFIVKKCKEPGKDIITYFSSRVSFV